MYDIIKIIPTSKIEVNMFLSLKMTHEKYTQVFDMLCNQYDARN